MSSRHITTLSVVVLAGSLSVVPSAFATTWQLFAGSGCLDLFENSAGAIAHYPNQTQNNSGVSSFYTMCGLTRHNVYVKPSNVSVRVLDGSTAAGVSCTLSACDYAGQNCVFKSASTTASDTGGFVLPVTPSTAYQGGALSVYCILPPAQAQISGVTSIYLVEP